MRRLGLTALVLVLAAAAAVAAVASLRPVPMPPDRPSVLLVTLDTTRADHLGCYGYFRNTTPNLDALARRSLLFERAWAPMATTLPSHTTLMTGAWPLEHGVLANVQHGGRRALPSDALVPVAELFRKAGYRTAGFTSATPVKPGTGIERGFEVFEGPGDRNLRKAKPTTDDALAWLRANGAAPFFVWVHYFDPHGPFDPPEPFDTTFRQDARLRRWLGERAIPEVAFRPGGKALDPGPAHDGYDGELRYLDDQFGRLLGLLQRRGWDERTVIVVVGDHGEGLGQHDVGGHGHVWREQLQVPLVVHVPWMEGRRIAEPVAMADVAPTLLGLVPVPGAAAWKRAASGRDVLREPSGPALGISSLRQAHLGTPEQLSLTAGDWRYVEQRGAGALYHLGTDPHELVDLGPVLPVHLALLRAEAHRTAAAQRARGEALGTGGTVAIPAEELAGLEALGYLDPGGEE